MPVSSAASWRPLAGLAGDVVEVRRLAADDAANGDHAGVPARPRQGHGAQRQLEGARDRDDVDAVALDARALQSRDGAVEEPGRSRR